MSRINDISELRAEIARLKKLSGEQKQQIKNDVNEIGDALKPSNLFFSFLSSVSGIKIEKNEFLKNGIAFGIALLIQRYVLKTNAGHKVLEWLDSVINKIKDFTSRDTDTSGKSERTEEGNTSR